MRYVPASTVGTPPDGTEYVMHADLTFLSCELAFFSSTFSRLLAIRTHGRTFQSSVPPSTTKFNEDKPNGNMYQVPITNG